ncbi:AsmA-like C-terminal region-containing protein [Falsiroseomonas sp.]|uniref:AsmA-like C-terminal region-containing protein n=1 Tax=Falsiroseomonas sp. TaxID=2870721 RepID=UPI0035637AED
MRQAAGQVARRAHRLAHLALGAAMLALLGLAVLGGRLAQGPIELTALARIIEEQVNTPAAETRLEIGQVSIGWEGWLGGGLTPLDLRVSAVRLLDRDGTMQAELPDASVSLAIPWLLRGELAPSRLELRNPVLRLRRAADGGLSLLLGGDEAASSPAAPGGATALDALLAEMMRPPSDDTPFSALTWLGVTGARVTVEDAVLGATWALDAADIELRRLREGGLAGSGAAMLRLGAARVPVSGTAEASGSPAEIAFRLLLPSLRPAALATLAPPLAPLAHLDAPAQVALSARLGADGAMREAAMTLAAGAGALDLGEGRRVPLAGVEGRLAWRPEQGLSLQGAVLRLAGPGTPTLNARATARREGERWRAETAFTLDAAPIAELHRWWPEDVAAGPRAWILPNITAGTVRNGSWRLAAEAGPDLSGLELTAAEGSLEVADATVHWLRPIPPVEAVTGTIGFGLSEVEVRVASARQQGQAVQARDATLRFLFPPGDLATTEMRIGIAGPVPDILAVLQHPRLRLFERRPLPLRDPRGVLEGTVTLGFPLLNELQVEQIRVAAQAQLRQVRLADILLDRPLERGVFDLTVDTEGLRVTGTATLAEIPARLGVEMDFRSGPATQVVMRETVVARPTAAQLAALGLASEELVRGPVGLDVRTERRRNGAGRVAVRADLREAALAVEPLGWAKPPGQNAGADALLRLSGENLEAIESFRIEAPSLLLRGNAAFGRGTRLTRVTINEGRIEASRFAGEARPPGQPGAPWQVTLRGAALDLRGAFGDDAPAGAPAAEPGPALALDGRFERVLLGPGRELGSVEAQVLVDGRGVVRQGQVAGRAGPRGPFRASITPDGTGRALQLTADDAGALLAAFDVLQHLEGGRLSVAARYTHNGPGAPLLGNAEMDDFAVRNAPALGKLLQAMTLYGLLEALSGPGLNFARMVAPFALTPDTLALEDARAFSASLGLTAKGTLDRRRRRLAMEGTIVPAYIFNSLLGNIPILGRLFSPEAGGGVFAATFRVQGPLDDPQVSVNPLAALTPGFLRGLFGIGQQPAP